MSANPEEDFEKGLKLLMARSSIDGRRMREIFNTVQLEMSNNEFFREEVERMAYKLGLVDIHGR